ncbi:MAG: ribulose-phosphate 3-epimerase [Pirellulales bacterium]|nr:ribulose-phosphate 3-epimerase [Pirellulales bacterium]
MSFRLENIRGQRPVILPSLLLCDFGNLAAEVSRLQDAGINALHLDVMDGHFVPNLSYGMPIVEGLRNLTDMPLDVHLMISNPTSYVQQFVDAGSDLLTVHVEACEDPVSVIKQINESGIASGIALNPATEIDAIDAVLADVDVVLVMSVQAGFGGQSFQPVALEKLRQLAALREANGYSWSLEVDGGINTSTVRDCFQAGADWFVAGSAIFKQECYQAATRNLVELCT